MCIRDRGLRTQKAEASTVIALPPNHYKYTCLTDIIFKHDPTGSGNSRATQPDWVRDNEDIWIWLVKSNLEGDYGMVQHKSGM